MTTLRLARGACGFARLATARPRAPYVVVWGNHQAEALRTMLHASATFRSEYDTVWLPGAHEVTRSQLPLVRRLIARADVVLAQPVSDDYRALPTGTGQILEYASNAARVVRCPSMIFTGLHPYAVHVHPAGGLSTPAPLTEVHHDLRFIAAAALRVADAEAERWLAEHPGDAAELRANAAESLDDLVRCEKTLDVRIGDRIESLGPDSFWAPDRPSNELLAAAVAQVQALLEVSNPAPPEFFGHELLASMTIPVHRDVRTALAYEPWGSTEWVVGDSKIEDLAVMREHLAHYRAKPDVLAVAVEEHGERMRRFGLLGQTTFQ